MVLGGESFVHDPLKFPEGMREIWVGVFNSQSGPAQHGDPGLPEPDTVNLGLWSKITQEEVIRNQMTVGLAAGPDGTNAVPQDPR